MHLESKCFQDLQRVENCHTRSCKYATSKLRCSSLKLITWVFSDLSFDRLRKMLLKTRIFQTESFQVFIYNSVQKQTFLVMNDKDLNSYVHHMMQNNRKIQWIRVRISKKTILTFRLEKYRKELKKKRLWDFKQWWIKKWSIKKC